MKFLADMGISPKTALFLRTLGYDSLHLHDHALDRLSDVDILKKARNEKRILITHDLDFGGLVAAIWKSITERHHFSFTKHAS